jgi:hypothetical protein
MKTRNNVGQASCLSHSFPNRLLEQWNFKLETGKMPVLLCLALLLCQSASAQSYSIDWFKIAGGGGTSTGATYQVSGTIGQPDASGAMTGGNYSVTGGFWSLIAVVQTPGSPNLTITFVGPNSVVVSWPNTGSYTLQQTGNLSPANWTSFGGTVNSNSTTMSVTITLPTGNLFFRLSNP